MKEEINFMSFENLSELIEGHKKETHPYKEYSFDSTSYMLLLIDISKLQQKNQQLKETINKAIEKLYCWGETLNPDFQKEMLKILKGVEDSGN